MPCWPKQSTTDPRWWSCCGCTTWGGHIHLHPLWSIYL
jgi:hypothetical protein